MAKSKKQNNAHVDAQVQDTTNTTEPVASNAAGPATTEQVVPKGKGKRGTKGDATLERVFEGYLAALEKDGKSDGTISSYRMELQTAGAELGLETKVAELQPDQVLLFFSCPRVMKKKSGKAKSQLSIDKTRRVLRQALVWAEGAKLVARAPLPELAATH